MSGGSGGGGKSGRSGGGGNAGGDSSVGGNGDFSSTEKSALQGYASTDYISINNYLYGDKSAGKIKTSDDISTTAAIKRIDAAMAKSSLSSETVLYRGINERTLTKMRADPNFLKVGSTMNLKGFTSTSTDTKAVDRHMRGDHTAKMVIKAPKGTKAIDMDALSSFKGSKGEKETLLNRGATLRLTGVKTKKMLRGRKTETTLYYEVV